MRPPFLIAAAVLVGVAGALPADWRTWRGPIQTGAAAPGSDPPVEWSGSVNVAWKTPLPGRGHSTPVVVGDRVFVTTAVPFGDPLPPKYSGRPGAHSNLPVTSAQRFVVVCLDLKTGEEKWNRVVREAVPHEGGHQTGSLASASPAADDKRVYAFFGSHGLYALDQETGRVLWEKDLGDMHSKHGHGEGATPVLHDGMLVVNWDEEGPSFVAGFDTVTGEERWRTRRDEKSSWTTPIVVEPKGQTPQVVVSGTNRIRGYDLRTGDLLWHAAGLSANVVAAPVYHPERDVLVAGSSYNLRRMVALRLRGASGDLDGTDRVLWEKTSRTPYVPSLLLRGDAVYHLTHYQGVLIKTHVETGELLGGPWRLLGMREIYASPVAAKDRIYVTDRTGTTAVLQHAEGAGKEGDQKRFAIAVNRLGEEVNASLVLLKDALLIRGTTHLFKIAGQAKVEAR